MGPKYSYYFQCVFKYEVSIFQDGTKNNYVTNNSNYLPKLKTVIINCYNLWIFKSIDYVCIKRFKIYMLTDAVIIYGKVQS